MRRLAALAAAAALGACAPAEPQLGPLPDFSLTAVSADANPGLLRRQDILGRVWIADFIFTRCSGPCPMLSNTLARLQQDLPPSVGLLSLTVDPDRDDSKTLAAYARRFGAQPGRWLFVTGPKPMLFALLIDGFKVPAAEDPQAPSGRRVTHSTRLVLIDRQANIRGYFDAEDPAALARLRRAASSIN